MPGQWFQQRQAFIVAGPEVFTHCLPVVVGLQTRGEVHVFAFNEWRLVAVEEVEEQGFGDGTRSSCCPARLRRCWRVSEVHGGGKKKGRL